MIDYNFHFRDDTATGTRYWWVWRREEKGISLASLAGGSIDTDEG